MAWNVGTLDLTTKYSSVFQELSGLMCSDRLETRLLRSIVVYCIPYVFVVLNFFFCVLGSIFFPPATQEYYRTSSDSTKFAVMLVALASQTAKFLVFLIQTKSLRGSN